MVASLAAADSLALPPEYEIHANGNFADSDSLPPPPEYEVHAENTFTEASLAAADSLALPPDEESALPSEWEEKRRKKRHIVVSVLSSCTFLLVGIIVLSIVLTKTDVGRNGESIDNLKESIKDDNILSSDPDRLHDIYFVLESKVHNPAALLDMGTPEGKAYSTLVEERKAKTAVALRSTDDFVIQRYALLVLHFGTDGGAWTNTAGWVTQSEACEDWHGVLCENSLVTGIDLDGNNLDGKIPEDFCLMNRLKFLRLSGNKVKPPSCFSRLSELQELDFRSNDYAGELPIGLYAIISLTSLELSDNEFVGSIDVLFPEVKSSGPIFPNLLTLNLANNNLSGEIPESSLRRLRSLDKLILNGNPQLSGSLNEMCKGDDISEIDADCDNVSCKCCTKGKNCPSSMLPV